MRFKTVFLTILFSLFVISGCSNSDSVPTPVTATATPAAATATPAAATATPAAATANSNFNDRNDSFPKTITDLTGDSFVLDGIPKNVVSISPAATEILFAIGAGDSVIQPMLIPPHEVVDSSGVDESIAGHKDLTVSGVGCPDCGSVLYYGEGCLLCRDCGYSKCG